jgi:hypothetical protein
MQNNFKPETLEKVARVAERVKNGELITAACRSEGMPQSQLHAMRMAGKVPAILKIGKTKPKPKPKPKAKKSKPKFVDLVNPHTGSDVAVLTTGSAEGATAVGSVVLVVCTPDQLKYVIASLR